MRQFTVEADDLTAVTVGGQNLRKPEGGKCWATNRVNHVSLLKDSYRGGEIARGNLFHPYVILKTKGVQRKELSFPKINIFIKLQATVVFRQYKNKKYETS